MKGRGVILSDLWNHAEPAKGFSQTKQRIQGELSGKMARLQEEEEQVLRTMSRHDK